MMRKIGGVALGLTAAACAPTLEQEIPTRDDPRFTCNAAPVQSMVGQIGTGALGTEALRLANARALRWIGPDQAVTLDYRTDRLNIHHDARYRITRITCG